MATWEVYKPAAQRRWGYYVLPVFYGDRFIARLDSRLIGNTWNITNWWWEPDCTPSAEIAEALNIAIPNFLHYLRAQNISVEETVDQTTSKLLYAAVA